MAFPLPTLLGRQFKQMATGETGRRQSLIVIKDIKERQNTRELEISLYGQEDTIFRLLGCITLSTISIKFWSTFNVEILDDLLYCTLRRDLRSVSP